MIVVLDYGMGNLDSVVRAFNKAGVTVKVSADAADIASASGMVLPGVGAFAGAMHNLRGRGLVELLHRRVLADLVPVLGICLGFQLMTSHGEEGDADGLGWLGGATRRFRFAPGSGVKIPHMGWNDLQRQAESPIFDGIDPRACFYFAHSYHVTDPVPGAVLATSVHGEPFISGASLNGHIFGTQFHPEKSYDNGIRILANFARRVAHE
jgi:imidazole glycerol-phosphate synthase subunit HisH